MSEPEEKIIALESSFPALSGITFHSAMKEALDAGLSVLQSRDGILYELFPDGARHERKRIEPPTPMPAGTKVEIR